MDHANGFTTALSPATARALGGQRGGEAEAEAVAAVLSLPQHQHKLNSLSRHNQRLIFRASTLLPETASTATNVPSATRLPPLLPLSGHRGERMPQRPRLTRQLRRQLLRRPNLKRRLPRLEDCAPPRVLEVGWPHPVKFGGDGRRFRATRREVRLRSLNLFHGDWQRRHRTTRPTGPLSKPGLSNQLRGSLLRDSLPPRPPRRRRRRSTELDCQIYGSWTPGADSI